MLAVFFLQYVELVRSKFRGAVMRVFRDRRADSDRSLRLGWTIFVWLMTRQLVSDVDLVEQAELDRLEGLPPCLPGHGLSYGTCDVSVDHVFGDQVLIFVDVATLPPTGVVMAAAAMSERAVPRLASPAMSAKVGRVRGPSVTEKRRMEEEVALARKRRGESISILFYLRRVKKVWGLLLVFCGHNMFVSDQKRKSTTL